MTWSILARDPASGAFGVAISTRFFAVGALCPHAASGVGALSTQALVNPHYGRQGLDLLRAGVAAPEVVKRLIEPDEGREHRQLHVIDAAGRIGQFTGKQCVEWAGALAGDGYSVAGNMLAGPKVVSETGEAFKKTNKPFAERLIRALQAGEAAGGDKRGKQSAALLIHGEEEWSELNLRVDDHTDPLRELARLEEVSRERWVHFRPFLPTRKNPAGITDRATIDAGIEASIKAATAGKA
jgi:uncharacterized Ntn-hydrolase superfamily protein